MTNPPPILLSGDSSESRRRINGWELALWILGVALIAVATWFTAQLTQMDIDQQNEANASGGISNLGYFQAFYQTAAIAVPGFVTGSIACFALAIFVRALDFNARRRVLPVAPPAIPLEQPIEPQAPAPTPAAVELPEARSVPTMPSDYSAYMRPADDPDAPAK